MVSVMMPSLTSLKVSWPSQGFGLLWQSDSSLCGFVGRATGIAADEIAKGAQRRVAVLPGAYRNWRFFVLGVRVAVPFRVTRKRHDDGRPGSQSRFLRRR